MSRFLTLWLLLMLLSPWPNVIVELNWRRKECMMREWYYKDDPVTTVVYTRLATLISEKRGHPYNQTPLWIRCKLSYSLLRSAGMCLRGSRSSYHRTNLQDPAIDLACSSSMELE